MNLKLVFESGDFVLISVFICLILMSIATWCVAAWRLYKLKQTNSGNKNAYQQFWASENLETAVEKLKNDSSPVAELVRDAINARKQFNESQQKMLSASLPKGEFLEREIRHSTSKILNRYDSGLSVLASVGSTGPFIGLLGTVWGIYHALINISASGQMSIAAVAGPIGEALVATAVGLFAAIPAVLAYNYLNRKNKLLSRYLNSFAHDLHVYLINAKESKESKDS